MPDECHFSLMSSTERDTPREKQQSEQQSEQQSGSLLTPIPHKLTEPDFFVLRAREQPWRWSTAFEGLDDYGQGCDGFFEKNVKTKGD